ncbi:hypothetical protein ACFRKD_31745 [Streptomyces niveus]|uniref:hypothetical protein n=1 Tax=Streptomyces niveus TaxID=193462 RepID=UPI0036BC14ED
MCAAVEERALPADVDLSAFLIVQDALTNVVCRDFSAGPRPEGGFRVTARLPLPPQSSGGSPMAAGPVRVVLADDQPLVRSGLRLVMADPITPTWTWSAEPQSAPTSS